jgi:hypothetical protein
VLSILAFKFENRVVKELSTYLVLGQVINGRESEEKKRRNMEIFKNGVWISVLRGEVIYISISFFK